MWLRKTLVVTTLFSLLAPLALAQGTQRIIVTPPGGLTVSLVPDRGTGGNYFPGEQVRLTVTTSQNAFLYLYSFDAGGNLDILLPNSRPGGSQNFIAGNTPTTFPRPTDQFAYTVTLPAGPNSIVAVATLQQVDPNSLLPQVFAALDLGRTQGSVPQTQRIIVTPPPPPPSPTPSGVASTFINVLGSIQLPPPPPAFGTLSISSNPAGAQVFLNGAFVGTTGFQPLLVNAAPGRNALRFTLAGFADTTVEINIQAGRTVPVNITLTPVFGSLDIRCNVVGARVFVNGGEVGAIGIDGRLQVPNLAPGEYQVVVVSPGFRVFTDEVNISSSRAVRVNATLRSL
ncbi:MAG: PEGA domain-containing protein [Deinococcus sp.]|nr:PEGA domain-containing protein [Deinococcus sp.]